MHFTNFLQRYFDIEIEHTFDPTIQGSNETGKDVTKIWIYEKGEDSEPLLRKVRISRSFLPKLTR